MQRCSNIKVKNAGVAGCIGVFCLLMAVLVMPLVPPSVYADDDGVSSATDGVCGDDLKCDISKVSIAFTQDNASVTEVDAPAVTPIDGKGIKTHVEVGANIKVESSNGYRVYIGSNSQYLRKDGTSETDKIAPVDGECKDDEHGGKCTYNALPVNQWGYAWTKGSTIDAETATYYAMPKGTTTTPFDTVESKDLEKGANGENGQDYAFAFAANINSNIPAGKYSNKVTLSVISDPLQTSKAHNDFDITTMQEMNNKDSQSKNACARAEIGATGQLKDERDGKYYWVTKLRDGNCWMTQNLDLDIKTSGGALGNNSGLQEGVWPDAAKSDYDSAPDIKIFATSTKVISGKTTNNTNGTPYTASWSLGDYRMNYTNETIRDNGSTCGNGKADASECTTVDNSGAANPAFVAYTTPTSADGKTDAHYILGNHYQWTVAAANTTNGTASICPKGWKLPTSNSTTASGSFGKLITPGGSNDQADITSVSTLVQDPYYFVRGGVVNQSAHLFNGAGIDGYYWSSAPSGNSAYNLSFGNASDIHPSSTGNRNIGVSVRCIAR